MTDDSDLDIGTDMKRLRRHTKPTLLEAELVSQARSSMARLARRAECFTGRHPDWSAHTEELEMLLRVAMSQRGERVRAFGIAGFLPGRSKVIDRKIEKLYVARIGTTMRRPLINESRDLEHDPAHLVWAPFLTVSPGVGQLVQRPWIDLRTWQIQGSMEGFIRFIDEPRRLFPRVGITDTAGGVIRTEDRPFVRESINESTARTWGWRPGAIIPVTFTLCRRETGGSQMEIVRSSTPF